MAEINQNILDLAARLKEFAKVDETKGQMTFDKDAFAKTLPEGLTTDIVSQVQKHVVDVGLATTHLAGDAAADHFKANKEAEKFQAVFKGMGQQTATATIHRSYTKTNPFDANATPTVVHNHATLSVSTKISTSQLKAVREAVASMASRF